MYRHSTNMIEHLCILSHFSWINVSFKWNGNVMSIVDYTGLTTFLIELLWLLLAKLAYCFISLNERKYGVVLFYAIDYWFFIIILLHNTSETYHAILRCQIQCIPFCQVRVRTSKICTKYYATSLCVLILKLKYFIWWFKLIPLDLGMLHVGPGP